MSGKSANSVRNLGIRTGSEGLLLGQFVARRAEEAPETWLAPGWAGLEGWALFGAEAGVCEGGDS